MNIQQDTLSMQGVQVHFRTAGREGAPAVLMLHGWASSSLMWTPTMEHLAQAFYCVAIDLPGHGASSKPPADWYTIPRYSHVVCRTIEHLGLAAPFLLGHSMGGAIAISVAARCDHMLQGLVLVNPAVAELWPTVGPVLLRRAYRPALALGRSVWPRVSRAMTVTSRFDRRWQPGNVVFQPRLEMARTTADSALGSIHALMTSDLTPDLASIECPTLVIVGTRDLAIPPAQGRLAAREIVRARLVEIPSGHHPYLSHTPDYYAALDRFLTPKGSS